LVFQRSKHIGGKKTRTIVTEAKKKGGKGVSL